MKAPWPPTPEPGIECSSFFSIKANLEKENGVLRLRKGTPRLRSCALRLQIGTLRLRKRYPFSEERFPSPQEGCPLPQEWSLSRREGNSSPEAASPSSRERDASSLEWDPSPEKCRDFGLKWRVSNRAEGREQGEKMPYGAGKAAPLENCLAGLFPAAFGLYDQSHYRLQRICWRRAFTSRPDHSRPTRPQCRDWHQCLAADTRARHTCRAAARTHAHVYVFCGDKLRTMLGNTKRVLRRHAPLIAPRSTPQRRADNRRRSQLGMWRRSA